MNFALNRGAVGSQLGAAAVGFVLLLTGCGGSSGGANPSASNQSAYRVGQAEGQTIVSQAIQAPIWSTFGDNVAFPPKVRGLPIAERESAEAVILAYSKQLENTDKLPRGATASLASTFAQFTPQLTTFLHGEGAKIQAEYLNSDSFKTTIGCHLARLQDLVDHSGIPASCK